MQFTCNKMRLKVVLNVPFGRKLYGHNSHVSELEFNVPPTTMRLYCDGTFGLKSHPKDCRSGGLILQSLDWLSSVLSTPPPPLPVK